MVLADRLTIAEDRLRMSRIAPLEAQHDVKVSPAHGRGEEPARRRAAVRFRDPELDDAELVRRALEGDAWARAAIYHRHARTIANLGLRLLRSRDAAADLLQDTFVRAFETLPTLRDPERLLAWLRTIAVREAQRRFRRQRLLRLLGIGPAPGGIPLEELAPIDGNQEARAQLARVDAVLRVLPHRALVVWTLRLVEEQSLPEIAETCGISLATVKRDLALAQDEVRRALEGDA